MSIVPQQSDRIFVFLHTLPSEFTYSFFIYKVYFIKEIVEVRKILKNWNVVHMDSLELQWTESIRSTDEQIENIDASSSSF